MEKERAASSLRKRLPLERVPQYIGIKSVSNGLTIVDTKNKFIIKKERNVG